MKRLIWTLSITVVLLGCAPTYKIVARPDPDATVTLERSAEETTKSWEQAKISVRAVPPRQMPSWVRRNFSVFEVILENLGGEALPVQLDQFALVDANQVQYSPVSPEELDRVADRYHYPASQFSLGFGLSHDRHRYPRRYFGYGYRYHDGFPIYIRGDTAYLRALHGGSVVPRSKKQGWLFFERVEERSDNRFDLYYLVDGKIRLVFPFEIVQEF